MIRIGNSLHYPLQVVQGASRDEGHECTHSVEIVTDNRFKGAGLKIVLPNLVEYDVNKQRAIYIWYCDDEFGIRLHYGYNWGNYRDASEDIVDCHMDVNKAIQYVHAMLKVHYSVRPKQLQA